MSSAEKYCEIRFVVISHGLDMPVFRGWMLLCALSCSSGSAAAEATDRAAHSHKALGRG